MRGAQAFAPPKAMDARYDCIRTALGSQTSCFDWSRGGVLFRYTPPLGQWKSPIWKSTRPFFQKYPPFFADFKKKSQFSRFNLFYFSPVSGQITRSARQKLKNGKFKQIQPLSEAILSENSGLGGCELSVSEHPGGVQIAEASECLHGASQNT